MNLYLPTPCDDPGAVMRADLVLVGVYQLVDGDGVEQLLFGQERLDRFRTK